ncbi:hypothetical protein Tco_1208498, partial [Tanacetum coccineum]
MKCPQHYLTDMQEVILFYNGLDVPTRQILDSKGAIPTKTAADAKIAVQEMAEYSQKWHNGEIKKVNEKVYAAQVGCELCKGPHYTKDCSLKEEGNTLKEGYYTRQTLEESLTKFMAESAKRQEENSNIIKESRASTDVLQERGIGGLPGSTEPNPRDHVKLISTTQADSSKIRHMGCSPYAAEDVKILEAYDHTLPQKEKDPRSFTLPCFIHNVCFNKALVNLGASVSVMPFSTYTNLGLGILSHTRLTIELADRTLKQSRGIAENTLVRIGEIIFPIDFVILDIPEDDDVPLFLVRPLLSNAHSKIDVYKRKT